MLENIGPAAMLGLFVGTLPVVMGLVFAIRPTERRLALMRPVSLAGIFVAVCNLLLGLVNALTFFWSRDPFDPETVGLLALALAEAMVASLIGFACLTVAWLAVAVGMRKQL